MSEIIDGSIVLYDGTEYSDGVNVEFPPISNPSEEVRTIISEFRFGTSKVERSLFRLWRVWRDDTYKTLVIETDDGRLVEMYPTWKSFWNDLKDVVGASRAKVFSRFRVYSVMTWGGYSEQEIYNRMMQRPWFYDKIVSSIVNWDSDLRMPIGFKVDSISSDPSSDLAKEQFRDLISLLERYDNVKDALDVIDIDLNGRPKVGLVFENGDFIIKYEVETVDEDGGIDYTEGTISYYSEEPIPVVVFEEIERRWGKSE